MKLSAVSMHTDTAEVKGERMLYLNETNAYRLVDVLNHERKSKVDERGLYKKCIGCVTNDFQTRKNLSRDGYYFQIDFIEDAEGNFINRHLQTSAVSNIEMNHDIVEIHTKTSIYILKAVEVTEPELLDEKNLIELYISDDYEKFCRGFHYDAQGHSHELANYVHVGTFTDSCLIYKIYEPNSVVCSFFPHQYSIEFYRTIHDDNRYFPRFLIHNTGKSYLTVTFEGLEGEWQIAPGEEEWLLPYDSKHADEEE